MSPDPELIPLLVKYKVTLNDFSKKGRLPGGLRYVYEARRQIVTDLHISGKPWSEIIRITGLSNGSIQRLTKAMWNSSSRANRVSTAKRQGFARKGEVKPWLSGQMKLAWSSGKFDFHKDRRRTEGEIQTQKKGYTSEVRSKMRAQRLALWSTEDYRNKLLSYHRDPQVRAERSQAQTRRLLKNPPKGLGGYVSTLKGPDHVWTRSSYERFAIQVLDGDPTVLRYEYEKVLSLEDGRRILPDFLVTYVGGRQVLIEVKASWTLKLPKEHKVSLRLARARIEAKKQGWGFEIWTEKDRLSHVVP